MGKITDAEFEASIEQYHADTYRFRQLLDNRSEEEIVRDDYVLDQHSRGKRMKVVLKKASKKLKLLYLSPDSPHYPDWVNYYENLVRIIMSDLRIEAYYQNKMKMLESEKGIAEKQDELRNLLQNQQPSK